MEEYLQYMKTLRSQINDVEDQAANVSAEEQIHFTTIQTLQNDILSAKSMKQQLMEDIEKMLTAKGQLCSLIIEKQRKIAALDSDSTTLAQVISLSHSLINNEGNDLIVKLDLEKAKLDGIEQMKATLMRDNEKPELLEISVMALEEEYKALLSDKDGETEYLCSLQDHLERIKGISHVIKCACGEEYMLDLRA
ncbi:hypothetical protein V6Z11_D08G272000 [Gossypium hirsutum]